jgi:hypothetical protein
MVDHNYTDDDEKPDEREGKFWEFDCPDCNANNPHHDGFAVGGEVLCYYCGTTFKVVEKGSSFKLKEV